MEKLNSKHRGRPELLDDTVKNYIVALKRKYPKMPAWEILNTIHSFDKKKNLPGVNRVQKFIRERFPEGTTKPDCLDNIWHLGTLEKHRFPSDTLPYIFALQDYLDEHPSMGPLSIRQIKWLSRICKLYNFPIPDNELKELYQASLYYARKETEAVIAGLRFDTTEIDKYFRQGRIIELIKSDILNILNFGDRSPYSKAKDRQDKALFTDEQLKKREREAEQIIDNELIKARDTGEALKKYLNENPQATDNDIAKWLLNNVKDGEA